jgi:triphosphatase
MEQDFAPGIDLPTVATAPEESSPPPALPVALELTLPLAAAERLSRVAALAGAHRGRQKPLAMTFHDGAESELASQGLALSLAGRMWSLTRLGQTESQTWPPATPAPLLGQSTDLAALNLPAVLPVASYQGRQRLFTLGDSGSGGAGSLTVTLHQGELCAFHGRAPHAWLHLEGPAALLAPFAHALAAEIPLTPPRATLAAEALAFATGRPLPTARGNAPDVPLDATVAEGFDLVLAHLTRVILDQVREIVATEAPEPVHQARVGVRRLRAAIALFTPALPGPALIEARTMLRAFAGRLGTARDWDVFVTETGAEIAHSIADKRVATLLSSADRRRTAIRADLRAWLDSLEGRATLLDLSLFAACRAWQDGALPSSLSQRSAAFAAGVLARRHRRILRRGAQLAQMNPEQLHELRKQCKKLRYAAELFRSAFPPRLVKKFLTRLEAVQAELGHANDAATSEVLLDSLGSPGRGWAAGAVAGHLAARSSKSGRRIAEAWTEFRDADPFWA